MKAPRFVYSFIVDGDARFPYQAWHLARSLERHCGAKPSDIHIQCTADADSQARNIFAAAGFRIHHLERFGDGTYCNKLSQIDNLLNEDFDVLVLLDTDMLAVSDLRPWLSTTSITAKIVDAENPPLDVLRAIARLADLEPNATCSTDNARGLTFEGNCNGGMYSVPRAHCEVLSHHWKSAATWLLENLEPLRAVGKTAHVDQVSFWLAMLRTRLPLQLAAANANYFVHDDAPHSYFDETRPIALLHYHNSTLNVRGAIETPPLSSSVAQAAVAKANAEMALSFNNALFWNYRYRYWPERGSGIGSRGENLAYKRELLDREGFRTASSVLDIGCGDLEVIKSFSPPHYTGLDLSPLALERGKVIFPNGNFLLGLAEEVAPHEWVLCFEVLIHQRSRSEFEAVIGYAASRTRRTLIISGYENNTEAIQSNSMIFFHDSLHASLERTRKFRSVQRIGSHTDVTIFRCDV